MAEGSSEAISACDPANTGIAATAEVIDTRRVAQ
jgi:hypothetical protein